ncbi:hypothetical protein [Pelagibius sp. Alg239-R121]|uniref:hypothetical protein n=1 Tax=Pelagibius sp. Alg239-R121 TaxID=2993448 RepID=UPI0024A739BB|nr:hypothetical protein [Pelagibius sp. Alg239-R121]
MKSNLSDLLPRWETGFLVSVFSVGFFATLLSVAVMISDADAKENYCREYQTKVMIGGKEEKAYGTVCRKPGGAWKVQADASGRTQLAIAQTHQDSAPRTVLVVPAPVADAVYFEDGVLLLDDWPDEAEVLYYDDSGTTVIVEEYAAFEDEEIYVYGEPNRVIILENDDDEVIILD